MKTRKRNFQNSHLAARAIIPQRSALNAALELLLESQFDRKIVFLITDGYPTESAYTINDVFSVAESNGIEIAGVGIKLMC